MGLMERMRSSYEKYNPEDFVHAITLDIEIAPKLFRKLKSVALFIDTDKEIEDFQSIGVQCREILIELSNYIYTPSHGRRLRTAKEIRFQEQSKITMKS
ncbi:conserved protein of unknown function [Oenococcus oeni]|uniref:Uncharacterized protein n=2 Tax=Oenococcus oeni TaxID=1247 RepID=A0AAQ2ZFJ4_OENOE|nr:conserved protein of unknown function [Oenococcus oeni]